ncbi:head maturation protease, ClpP-related [Enterocloster lavalensis]|uniref:head maturation protease, ClpP-related n=1 Tax=Enterocloster lavalensis TaxID=460384 RepID=UPI00140E906F|nr:head maturation protease, ClpP-related [Enterocloster lavalensis]
MNSSNGWVYDWLGIENTSPKKIVKALAEAGGEDIEVYINSPGGDVFAGSEIYTELRSYGGKKLIRITGIAASAASVIAQAGECEISPTGMFMIHNVQTRAAGDYRVMDNTGDALRAANQAIMNAYVEKTHRDPEELQALMDRDTYLSAQQAIEYGFADRLMFQDGNAVSMQNGFGGIPENTIEKLRNLIKVRGLDEQETDEKKKNSAVARLKFLNLRGEKSYDKSRV